MHSKRVVSTLRRESLLTQDYMDLSNLTTACLNIPQEAVTLSQSAINSPGYGLVTLKYCSINEGYTPFPDGTRGFLYYFLPPFAPPLAGQVRFRVTPSQDPSSFSSGYDLRHPITTLPLSWSLCRMLISHRSLASLLMYDGLITYELVSDAIRLFKTEDRKTDYAPKLYALGQPFYLDLQTRLSSFDILGVVDGENVVERAIVRYPSASVYCLSYRKYPYTGESRSS